MNYKTCWNRGLTKGTDERVKKYGEKISTTKKGVKLGPRSEEYKRRKREHALQLWKNPEFIAKHKGVKRIDVSKRNKEKVGYKNPAWNNGSSFEPYSLEWTRNLKKQIRERDNYTCQLCKKFEKHVHHIDYNKKHCDPLNLVTLCNSDNTKVNFNREEYERCFKIMMAMNYGEEECLQ